MRLRSKFEPPQNNAEKADELAGITLSDLYPKERQIKGAMPQTSSLSDPTEENSGQPDNSQRSTNNKEIVWEEGAA